MTHKLDAIQTLVHLLNNGDEADRCYAARALGTIRAREAAETLVERLRDEDIDVCIDAATALGQIAKQDTIDQLLVALTNEPDSEVKTAVTTALGNFTGKQVEQALIELATRRPDEIEDDGDDWDGYWDIQLEAIKGLTRMGSEDAAHALVRLLGDDGQDIESEILKALACGGESGLGHLKEMLENSGTRTRRRIIHALRFNPSATSKAVLKDALKNTDESICIAALSSIEHLQATELFGDVTALVTAPSTAIRQAALKTFCSFAQNGGPLKLELKHVLPLLRDPAAEIRTTVLKLISKLVSQSESSLTPDDLQRIRNSLHSENDEEATAACSTLAEILDTDSVDQLLNILEKRDDDSLRREVIRCLGKFGLTTPAVMQALHESMTDSSRVIRFAALQTLLSLDQQNKDVSVVTLDSAAETVSDDERPLAPLEMIIAALHGELSELSKQPEAQAEALLQPQMERIDAINIDTEAPTLEPALEPVDASQSTLASLQESGAAKPMIPDDYPTSDPQLEKAEDSSLTSTLAALTQGNVEAALISEKPAEAHVQSIMMMVDELPDELQQFGDAVKANNAAADQMIDRSKKMPTDTDLKLLATRALADFEVAEHLLDDSQRKKLETVVGALILALSDQNTDLRREAAETIEQLARKNPRAPTLCNTFGGLVTQLQFGEPEFRVAAVKALGALEHKAGIPPLLDCLEDTSSQVQIHAIHALHALITSKWSDEKASHHIVLDDVTPENVTFQIQEMLKTPDNGVRKAAIDVLSALNHQDAVPQMVNIALENEGAMVRAVGQAMRNISTTDAVTQIIEQLNAADSTSERRFLIGILEEMFKPDQHADAA